MTSYWQRGWVDRWCEEAPASADFVVIGGGLAGLATAIRLREREASVVLLEAERVGFGASGRNAGFLSPLAAPVWVLGADRVTDYAWGASRMHDEMHEMARWIAARVPDCELAPAHYRMASAGRLWDAALGDFARAMEAAHVPHRVAPSKRFAVDMDAYTLHPYKLVRGLAEHAEEIGVQICEGTRVTAIEGTRVLTEHGAIDARRVVVCTNAYTPSISVEARPRAVTMHSSMAVSAPVGNVDRDADFVLEVGASQTYHRMHDGRLIYGGVDQFTEPTEPRVDMPAPVELAWSGKFQTTTTGLPIVKRVNDVVFNIGYGGTGVVLALACAPLAAAVASDTEPDGLLALIRDTHVPVRDALRAIGRIAWRFATPWSRRANE